ncbi:hypothetical protein QTL95_18300 [Rhizobium sp. S152]|uniref:hypothetical protein n=1 Tax=Rhizobium sp. S152 TaxID=3055038 RepID=UPI0025A957D8|nr:hypothetical protein [Rhizobium sp. S152]MDM9627846.1 hypothetical protein [Rhizobium sp. S152]
MATFPPLFTDADTPFSGGEYLSASERRPFQQPSREVMRLMTDFAKQAIAEGWDAETAFETFEELLDEHNDGLQHDERLHMPRYRAFEATFESVALAADLVLRRRRAH